MNVETRFLNYVAYPTMSDETSDTCPSSAKQLALAAHLRDELISMGLIDVELDQNGYVTATLPSYTPNGETFEKTVGFIAHMDTSDEAADAPIRPKTVLYDGNDICLFREKNLYLRESDYPYLANYRGQHLIVTDGTTLLGADDKAGIAEIMTALEELIASARPHGTIKVGFTPDEEIGRGADRFDVAKFGADFAYTVDGGALGELEFENFNAASAKITVHGISIHPGAAKGYMKNAALILCEFNEALPKDEIPAKTEGYEGFHHLCSMTGGIELASAQYIIRDHDREKFEAKKDTFRRISDALNAEYGAGTVELVLTDSYYNMREKILPCMYIVERAEQAMRDCGVEPHRSPIRGGTDGARLSFEGLPCPNLCTGGENFHSRYEFVSVEAMKKVTEILCRLMETAGKK